MTAPRIDAVLALAREGFACFPCAPREKTPATGHGVYDATRDEEKLRRWAARNDGYNWAIACGPPSGDLLVVDVDPRHNGDVNLARLEVEHGPLPPTRTAITGGGGRHLYFHLPPGWDGTLPKELATGIDLQGQGRYVVCPPSETTGAYSWASVAPIAEISPWVLGASAPEAMPVEKREHRDPTPYLRAALANECARLRSSSEGMRNIQLNKSAFNLGTLVGGAGLDRVLAEDSLAEAAIACGLKPNEVKATIRSGLNSGEKYPRTVPVKPGESPLPVRNGHSVAANLTCLFDVKPEKIAWLWPGRVPWGRITVLEGDPGLGKSTVTTDLAARGSRGFDMPDGSPSEPFASLLLSAEDDLATIIAPRLIAQDADRSFVYAMKEVVDAAGGKRLPALPGDVPFIEEKIEEIRAATGLSRVLVVLDPLTAYFAWTVDAHKDADVRRGLAPLAEAAERTGAAILLIRHLNKNAGASALYRGGGSIAIAGAARSVLLVAKDPGDDSTCIIASVKSNVARRPPPLRYRVLEHAGIGRIDWLGRTDVEAEELVAPAGEYLGSVDSAMSWLVAMLAAGPETSTDVRAQAKTEGIAPRTLDRAKERLGVISEKGAFGGIWRWRLPGTTKVVDSGDGGTGTKIANEDRHEDRQPEPLGDLRRNDLPEVRQPETLGDLRENISINAALCGQIGPPEDRQAATPGDLRGKASDNAALGDSLAPKIAKPLARAPDPDPDPDQSQRTFQERAYSDPDALGSLAPDPTRARVAPNGDPWADSPSLADLDDPAKWPRGRR